MNSTSPTATSLPVAERRAEQDPQLPGSSPAPPRSPTPCCWCSSTVDQVRGAAFRRPIRRANRVRLAPGRLYDASLRHRPAQRATSPCTTAPSATTAGSSSAEGLLHPLQPLQTDRQHHQITPTSSSRATSARTTHATGCTASGWSRATLKKGVGHVYAKPGVPASAGAAGDSATII